MTRGEDGTVLDLPLGCSYPSIWSEFPRRLPRSVQANSAKTMQPKRAGGPNAETFKGQHRTLGVYGDFDHVIVVARVGGGDLCGFGALRNRRVDQRKRLPN
jgi:hypothetical protein